MIVPADFHLSRLPVRHGVPVTAHEWRKSVRETQMPKKEPLP